jgi:site-specific DNA-methyltransferase (adenine-specific)
MIPPETLLDGRVRLHVGDMLDVLAALPEASVDSVVCDPPYHLTSIVKRFGGKAAAPAQHGTDGAFARASRGFMGQQWDGGDVAFRVETWAAVLRVLKPGGHLVAFSGTRTYHRMACAIEDAGFEIRDQLAWMYGTGFPKSHPVAKAIDRLKGAERRVVGTQRVRDIRNGHGRGVGDGIHAASRSEPVYFDREITASGSDEAAEWEGWGTALKPAQEPIALARKPLSEGSVAANVLRWGTGAINIDGCRVGWSGDADREAGRPASLSGPHGGLDGQAFKNGDRSHRDPVEAQSEIGRWPANVLHDGSDEVLGAFPYGESRGGTITRRSDFAGLAGNAGGSFAQRAGNTWAVPDDSGSAARFFFSAKADGDDRLGSKHPTVKPVDLMQWLVRLVTPPKGVVLDPFAGTGTTGEAAWREGFDAVLVEREPAYAEDIRRRMALALAGPATRKAESVKARGNAADAGPLFALDGAAVDGAGGG